MAAARQPDGSIEHRARAVLRRSQREDPVVHEGRLLGFVERMGDPTPGVVSVNDDAIRFVPEGSAEAGSLEWPLMELRAVQTSSSALQISPGDADIVQFKFTEDSPFRWEDLLRGLLGRAYKRAGRGEIIEFQPRILAA